MSTTDLDLARTGPLTPMGRFLRRFWIPVCRAEDLPPGEARPIRIMSEDFALYRGAGGRAQIIAYRCPHRGAQMHLGVVEGADLARAVMAGRVRFAAIDHPDRVRVQDIAVQAGQGRIADRNKERLGRSDTAIILWRRILERELRSTEEGRKLKQWTPAPQTVVPTLGF